MILIGTVHEELRGAKRLERLLDYLQPRHMSIECPEDVDADEFFEEHQENEIAFREKLSKIPMYPCVRALYEAGIESYHYEFTVPYAYAKRTGAGLFLVDHPGLRSGVRENWDINEADIPLEFKDPRLERMPADAIIKSLVKTQTGYYEYPAAYMAHEWNRISDQNRQTLNDQVDASKLYQNLMAIGPERREAHLAKRLRVLRPDVHQCGILHLGSQVPDEYLDPSIAPRNEHLIGECLKDIITQKILLIDADEL